MKICVYFYINLFNNCVENRDKRRQAASNSFLDSLMDKYGGVDEEPPDIPEEAFGKRKRKKQSKPRKRSKTKKSTWFWQYVAPDFEQPVSKPRKDANFQLFNLPNGPLFAVFCSGHACSPKAGGKKKQGYANAVAYRCVDARSVYATVCLGFVVTLFFFLNPALGTGSSQKIAKLCTNLRNEL